MRRAIYGLNDFDLDDYATNLIWLWNDFIYVYNYPKTLYHDETFPYYEPLS